MAEEFVVTMVREELERAGDTTERRRTRQQLQVACGVGSGDLEASLDELRAEGLVTEVAPGEWEWISEELREERAVARGEAPAAEPEERERVTAIESGSGRVEFARDAHVSMPRGVVAVLDEQALGALVKAGIENVGEGETFVFEVTP